MIKTFRLVLGWMVAVVLLVSCDGGIYNPPAPDFNEAASDEQAIAYADTVMEAMGGRQAWDATCVLSWEFLGARYLVWDKQTGDVRIESMGTDLKILMNVNTNEGRVWKDSAEMTHPDSLEKYLDLGNQIWVNDSYWLVMPFKLKDSNTTLKYKGMREITEGQRAGQMAQVLQLTFDAIGYTPENKYYVYIPVVGDKLICQWDYFGTVDEEVPTISTPWEDYQTYGGILLAGKHGKIGDLTRIAVHDSVPASVFNSFEPVNL